jgi:hypothetical protein
MKRTLLMSSIAATLMVASFIASAQAPASDSAQLAAAEPAQKTYTDPNDPSKGQDLVSEAKTPLENPATVGQDKSTGNNLVPEKKDGQPSLNAAVERPDFNTLDAKKLGYLTADDVSNQVWLSKNFARCNVSHDGHLTSQEYAKCLK